MRYLHEHGYASCILRRTPEPPDREAWYDRRENLWGEQFGLYRRRSPVCRKWVRCGSQPT